MNRFHIEQAGVLVTGFLLGAGVAFCLAPGHVLLAGLAGVLVSIYCREYFVRNCRGEIFGWSHARHDRWWHRRVPRPPADSQSHRP
jgi:hypothetical protein